MPPTVLPAALVVLALAVASCAASAGPASAGGALAGGGVVDSRLLLSGTLIIADSYLDQIYCVQWPGTASALPAWVCTVTRGSAGGEGDVQGEHVESWRSTDLGATWQGPVVVDGRNLTNSYSNVYVAPTGRIYTMFNRNSDNISVLPDGSHPGHLGDELGHHVMKYSDDGGLSWSAERYEVPMPVRPIDTANVWGGAVKMFWAVDQVHERDGVVFYAFTKIGKPIQSPPEEVFILASPNLATAANASDVVWRMLPDGDHGLRPTVNNTVCEEGHVLPLALSPGFSLIYRTNLGYLGASSTADPTAASGWLPTHFARYWSASPAATWPVKQTQGPMTLKRMSNGMYLFIYYNTASLGGGGAAGARNPYWLASGREEGGEIRFSQPEIVLFEFADWPSNAFAEAGGYADFIESADGRDVWITETNKSQARVHHVNRTLLTGLYTQATAADEAGGAAVAFPRGSQGAVFAAPRAPDFRVLEVQGDGITLGLWLTAAPAGAPAAALIDTTAGGAGAGIALALDGAGVLAVSIRDAAGNNATLRADDGCAPLLAAPGPHYAAAVADAGAHKLLLYVDGALCDGGTARLGPTAWLPYALANATGTPTFTLAPAFAGTILRGAWWPRALSTSELVANWRHGV